jgi:hypothetical protein
MSKIGEKRKVYKPRYFHYYSGETMYGNIGDWHGGDNNEISMCKSRYIHDQSEDYPACNQSLDLLKMYMTGVEFEPATGKQGYYNQINIADDFVIDSKEISSGYNLFDSKQAITSQLINYMSSIGKDREKTKDENLCLIESDILKCRNLLLELDRFYLGQNRGADQRRLSIEQRLFDLYREKRTEEATSWRDQLWLQRDLFAALKEYLDIQRRKNLVNEIMEGDYSTNQNHNCGISPKT